MFKNILFKDCLLEKSRFLENNMDNVNFNNCDLISTEIFRTSLNKIDLSTSKIEGIAIDTYSIKGVVVNSYQALLLSKILGIIIKEE